MVTVTRPLFSRPLIVTCCEIYDNYKIMELPANLIAANLLDRSQPDGQSLLSQTAKRCVDSACIVDSIY
eukprot:scaffold32002_cov73-Cyclotella_meneghiniana.AAC.3